MSEIPETLKYTESHEWVQVEGDNIAIIGITDHAQAALGDMVFVELPEVDDDLDKGEECGVIESVKAASDFYVPLTGKIIEINTDLEDAPELLNKSPYGDGWLVKIKYNHPEELDELLDASSYADLEEDNS